MSIQVVREQSIAYTESGLSEVRDDLYIKLESDLADWLSTLKGVKLSTFIFIALREAYVCADKGGPATIHSIVAETAYEERAVRYAVDWLLEHEFIAESDPLPTRQRTYRVKAFAWFGKTAKNATPSVESANCSRLQPVVVVERPNSIVPNHYQGNASQQQSEGGVGGDSAARDILQSCGIVGASLDRLSAVDENTALAWSEWIAAPPLGVRNPQGIAVSALTRDVSAMPPVLTAEKKKRAPRFQGDLLERFKENK